MNFFIFINNFFNFNYKCEINSVQVENQIKIFGYSTLIKVILLINKL